MLQAKFSLNRQNTRVMQIVERQLHDTWKHTRGDWKNHWTYEGGHEDPDRAHGRPPHNIRCQDDWDALCAHWTSERPKVTIDLFYIIIVVVFISSYFYNY